MPSSNTKNVLLLLLPMFVNLYCNCCCARVVLAPWNCVNNESIRHTYIHNTHYSTVCVCETFIETINLQNCDTFVVGCDSLKL